MDALDLCVFGKPAVPQFSSDTGLLVAAEGTEIGKDMIVVDPDCPCPDLLGNAHCPGIAAGKDAAAQTIDGIVGNGHSFFVAVILDDGDNGSEDFFLSNAHGSF